MAGIDKIYLKDYQEYKYFKDFCAKHTPEFFKKYNYELSPFDDITEEIFKDGKEHSISNFGTEADVFIIKHITDKDKFIVKITPIHETHEAQINGLTTETGYYSYDVYERFENPLLDEGWQVLVFIPSKEEDEDRITCGNALISETLTF